LVTIANFFFFFLSKITLTNAPRTKKAKNLNIENYKIKSFDN